MVFVLFTDFFQMTYNRARHMTVRAQTPQLSFSCTLKSQTRTPAVSPSLD